MSGIRIQGISKQFGEHTALNHVELDVHEGEFFSLLGPSGCGKTTLLNMIAGFLEPTTGSIWIGGKDVTDLPPYRRELGMVFQDYALFPHLSVSDNVAYGLKVRKYSRSEIRERVQESLALVQLESFAKRMPHQLSGGQRQRVAIARALAIRPAVLLLDEPLSNLDAKLRKEMQTELRNIQRRTGITTILVTHDQEEALSLSDRIGILGSGQLQQLGTPLDVYRRPSNRFVAEFIGQVNLIAARPATADPNDPLAYTTDHTTSSDTSAFAAASALHRYYASELTDANNAPLVLETGEVPAAWSSESSSESKSSSTTGENILFMLRPERIRVAPSASRFGSNINTVQAQVSSVSYAGNLLRLQFRLEGSGELTVHASDPDFPVLPEPGQHYDLYWQPHDLIVVDTTEAEVP